MKHLVITALLSLTAFGAQAQTSETRKSEDFKSLEVKNGIEVVFTQSNEPSLKVESDNKANLENIITEYRNGTLKVYMRELENGLTHGVAKVYVSATNVNNFKAVTGSSIKVTNKLNVDELTVKLTSGALFVAEAYTQKCFVKAESGSMFRGHIITSSFEGKAFGGAAIKITGTADTANTSCNSGSLSAGKFICQNADVKTINGSAAFVNATKSINADADNSSSITYYGEPTDVSLGHNMYAIKRDNLKLALN